MYKPRAEAIEGGERKRKHKKIMLKKKKANVLAMMMV